MLRLLLIASAFGLAACASTGAETAGGHDCFRAETVNGFNVIDRNTVEIHVGASKRYLLTTNWPTSNLDFSQHIGLRSSTGSICTGSGIGVEVVGGVPRTHYPIQSIARAPEPAPQS